MAALRPAPAPADGAARDTDRVAAGRIQPGRVGLGRFGRCSGPRSGIGWAIGGGLALAAAFPPVGAWFLGPAGPAALLLAVRGRRLRAAFGLGTLFGAVFFAGLLTWLLNLGVAAWLLLTVIQALATGLLGVAVAVLWRAPVGWAWRAGAVSCAWVAFEALRARAPFGGFPWGRLGFSQVDAPSAAWVSLGGVPLLSFLVAALGSVVAAAVLATGVSGPRRLAAAGAAVAVAALTMGGGAAIPVGAAAASRTPQATVAVVQGNVPRADSLAEQLRAPRVTRNHADATIELARRVAAGEVRRPDLVVWPENATDIDPDRDPGVRAAIVEALQAVDTPILVGAVLDAADGRARNVGQLWVPGSGPTETYQKRHLVPFGEYIPLRGLLGGVGDLALIGRDFAPGDGPNVITSGAIRIGDVICYEVAYDDSPRAAVRAGANLLVVQSNNATYLRDGQLGETLQQLDMARLRAIEHDRAVLVATTTGISALVAPDGEVVSRTQEWTRQVLTGAVELRTGTTWATRLGAWPEIVLVLGALVLPGVGVAARLRRRGAGRQPDPLDDRGPSRPR